MHAVDCKALCNGSMKRCESYMGTSRTSRAPELKFLGTNVFEEPPAPGAQVLHNLTAPNNGRLAKKCHGSTSDVLYAVVYHLAGGNGRRITPRGFYACGKGSTLVIKGCSEASRNCAGGFVVAWGACMEVTGASASANVGPGALVFGRASGTFFECSFKKSAGSGVVVLGKESVAQIHDSRVLRNAHNGVLVCSGGKVTVKCVEIRDNRWSGLVARWKGSALVMESCRVMHNALCGLCVSDSATAKVSGDPCVMSYFDRNSRNVVQRQAQATFQHCVMSNCLDDCGLSVLGKGSSVHVKDSVFRENKLAGVGATNQARLTLVRVQAIGNHENGVYVGKGASSLLISVTMSESTTLSGLMVTDVNSHARVVHCVASGNAMYGMISLEGATLEGRNCTAHGNRLGGVASVQGSSAAKLEFDIAFVKRKSQAKESLLRSERTELANDSASYSEQLVPLCT